ncbi:MAG: sigma-70 family RNA polymerase sigma factor [Bacteroidales bacterium]|nr:sigma-70 family RNA polymerase sigma factor [Bacteroidales bacterium]
MEWDQKEIIKACIRQDEQAQMALFQRYRGQFFGLSMRYVNNSQMAEEVMMDAFLDIFKSIKKFKKDNFESWMKTIVVHKAIDYFRKHKNDPVFIESEFLLEKQISQTPITKVETDDLFQLLHCLPAGYKMVFNLHVIEGYQHHEIAKKLGISKNTSKTQLRKAKQKLQELLEKGGYHG